MSSETDRPGWRFLTNHMQVLLCIARDPDVRTRDIATMVGITERATQRIVGDLADAGFIKIERVGRRNRYVIDREVTMRHRAQAGHEIGELLDLLRLDADADPGSSGDTPTLRGQPAAVRQRRRLAEARVSLVGSFVSGSTPAPWRSATSSTE